MKRDLSAEFVRSILDYDQETGVFRWREKYCRSVLPGRIAGRTCGKGYRSISIKGKHYASHRLAWLHVYGEWPANQIDHINRDKTDNRIDNLRDVTGSENCRNRSCKYGHKTSARGVTRHKSGWQAQICVSKRKSKYLGLFATEAEASNIYQAARLAERIAGQCGLELEI